MFWFVCVCPRGWSFRDLGEGPPSQTWKDGGLLPWPRKRDSFPNWKKEGGTGEGEEEVPVPVDHGIGRRNRDGWSWSVGPDMLKEGCLHWKKQIGRRGKLFNYHSTIKMISWCYNRQTRTAEKHHCTRHHGNLMHSALESTGTWRWKRHHQLHRREAWRIQTHVATSRKHAIHTNYRWYVVLFTKITNFTEMNGQ